MICTWKYDDSNDYWETSCGNTFVLLDGTPNDNNMKFCCYCGGQIVTNVLQAIECARYAMVEGNIGNVPIRSDVVGKWLQAIADAI